MNSSFPAPPPALGCFHAVSARKTKRSMLCIYLITHFAKIPCHFVTYLCKNVSFLVKRKGSALLDRRLFHGGRQVLCFMDGVLGAYTPFLKRQMPFFGISCLFLPFYAKISSKFVPNLSKINKHSKFSTQITIIIESLNSVKLSK